VGRAAQAAALAHAKLAYGEGEMSWTWSEPGDLARMLWPIVYEGADLLTSAGLARVKECPGCGWLFLDRTKNRSKRWCTMEGGCGDTEKMRRNVARRAAHRISQPAGGEHP
jgi:predicted RNA-binding Zn ribbon-like protein